MAATVVGQHSSSVMTQHYRREIHQRRNDVLDIKSPDGELGDVEANFQSLVNEMVQDGSKRSQSSAASYSQFASKSSSSSMQSKDFTGKGAVSSKKEVSRSSVSSSVPTIISRTGDSVVVAMPARVVPTTERESTGEVIVESQMSVRDRIKKLEKQLSQESLESPVPPEAILPRGKSGSIRSIADQFEHGEESLHTTSSTPKPTELIDIKSVKDIASSFSAYSEANTSNRNIEEDIEFKKVKDVASIFQEPFSPVTIKPPPPFSDNDQPEPVPPVPVLPPAMRKPPTPPAEPNVVFKPQSHPPLPWKKETAGGTQTYSETVSRSSTENISSFTTQQQPVQYSAQVKCEVRSRVNTPDSRVNTPDSSAHQQHQYQQQQTEVTRRTDRKEIQTSSSSSHTSSFVAEGEKGQTKSTFGAIAPTPLARTTAKPPRSDSFDSAVPKFSLLRSASAGSVGEALQAGMVRTKSDKDIPKFNVRKVKPASTYGTSKFVFIFLFKNNSLKSKKVS